MNNVGVQRSSSHLQLLGHGPRLTRPLRSPASPIVNWDALPVGTFDQTTARTVTPLSIPINAKLAHLFLVRSNLHHEGLWERFFDDAGDSFNIYVHPKWPEKVTTRLFRNRIVAGLCQTQYGHISLVEAELCLLKAAMSDEANHFFLLHSESCIPLRPFPQVYRELCDLGRSWLNYHREGLYRYNRIDSRAIPIQHFLKASQFFCLRRWDVEVILANSDVTAWQNAFCPDEHFFPTVLSMRGILGECICRALTFAHWDLSRRESDCGPATFHRLMPADIALLGATDCLFARKFAEDSDVSLHIRNGNSVRFQDVRARDTT